jgi:hypothetical protein
MATLLLASRSSCNESTNNEWFGVVADGDVILHPITWGVENPPQQSNRSIIVKNDTELFWNLDNYKVSSQHCGNLTLVPI